MQLLQILACKICLAPVLFRKKRKSEGLDVLSSNFFRQGIADSVVSLVKAQMIEAKKESLSRLNGPWA